jgi:4-hydroxy-3-methylbut-2-enyl diphosphate reductase
MKVTIDPYAGFCFGVENAIQKAEEELNKPGTLYSLGEIVHNDQEVKRLGSNGLKTVTHREFEEMVDARVLIRAHGEPPGTFELARQKRIRLIDATCPIVGKLQERVAAAWIKMKALNGTVLIYGKKGHPEVIGLTGRTDDEAKVVLSGDDLDGINFSNPIRLFAQTTMSMNGYEKLIGLVKERMQEANPGSNVDFRAYHTICGQMSRREPGLKKFARENDVIIFVSGKNSSNGQFLFEVCRSVNPRTWVVLDKQDVQRDWFRNALSAGVSGATSTPLWLLKEIAQLIETF